MTEEQKALASLKDNLMLGLLAVARNLDPIVGTDSRPIRIEISSEPYKDSFINFYRFNPADEIVTKSEVDINESSENN